MSVALAVPSAAAGHSHHTGALRHIPLQVAQHVPCYIDRQGAAGTLRSLWTRSSEVDATRGSPDSVRCVTLAVSHVGQRECSFLHFVNRYSCVLRIQNPNFSNTGRVVIAKDYTFRPLREEDAVGLHSLVHVNVMVTVISGSSVTGALLVSLACVLLVAPPAAEAQGTVTVTETRYTTVSVYSFSAVSIVFIECFVLFCIMELKNRGVSRRQ